MLELDRSLTDFNYYYFYLLQYLQLNKYHVDPDHPQIISNSIAALDAFEKCTAQRGQCAYGGSRGYIRAFLQYRSIGV